MVGLGPSRNIWKTRLCLTSSVVLPPIIQFLVWTYLGDYFHTSTESGSFSGFVSWLGQGLDHLKAPVYPLPGHMCYSVASSGPQGFCEKVRASVSVGFLSLAHGRHWGYVFIKYEDQQILTDAHVCPFRPRGVSLRRMQMPCRLHWRQL